MQIEERHRKAAQKSIQYLHQVTGFLKGESQHLRKLWVESVAQIIAGCEASSDPLAVAARMERAEAELAQVKAERDAQRSIKEAEKKLLLQEIETSTALRGLCRELAVGLRETADYLDGWETAYRVAEALLSRPEVVKMLEEK